MSGKREILEKVKEWERFLGEPCWGEMLETIETQIQVRVAQVMQTPLEDSSKAVAQEFVKGEYAALLLIRELPKLIVEELRTQLNIERNEDAQE
jgi:hypothetical protein